MEIESVGKRIESRIVYLLATSDAYIDEIHAIYSRGMLSNKYLSKVASLCLAFYKKFKLAPKDKLGAFFDNAIALNKIDPDTAAEMRIVISGFVSEPVVEDIEFEIEETYTYIQSTALQLIAVEAQDLLKEGKIKEAKELMEGLENTQRVKVAGSDLYDMDDEDLEDIFNNEDERILTLDGELGVLFNNIMMRNAFVALMGRGKVGKSHWLLYFARMGRNQGKKVIFFAAGDLTKRQCAKRIMQADGKTTSNPEYVQHQRIPYIDCVKNQKGICFEREGDGSLLNGWHEVDPCIPPEMVGVYKPCQKCKDKAFEPTISYKKVKRPVLDAQMSKALKEKWIASGNKGKLHIEHYPLGTLTCFEMRTAIKRICKLYGWENPDMVVIDHADAMAEEGKDERSSVNIRWRFLRSFGDIFSALILTATQSNSSAFDFSDLSLQSFSEDKRKIDNCSALVAINQTIEERQENVWRLAALLKREAPYDERNQCHCFGCLALGTPHLVSVHRFADPPKPRAFSR